jgi:hypothetical protein
MVTMACVKRFICALVALSFIFAGVPVQAKTLPCPMEKMKIEMQMSSSPADMGAMKMDMKDCDKCPKSAEKKQAEQKTKKSGCCDDVTCNAKCAALSSSSTLFPAGVVSFSPQMARGTVHPLPYLLPPSLALKTPEKPPKHLS